MSCPAPQMDPRKIEWWAVFDSRNVAPQIVLPCRHCAQRYLAERLAHHGAIRQLPASLGDGLTHFRRIEEAGHPVDNAHDDPAPDTAD